MEELQNGKDEFLLQTGPYRFHLPKVRTYARKNKKKVEKSDVNLLEARRMPEPKSHIALSSTFFSEPRPFVLPLSTRA